jgi:hypothetical protein
MRNKGFKKEISGRINPGKQCGIYKKFKDIIQRIILNNSLTLKNLNNMKKVYLIISMFLVVLLANGQKLPFQGKLIESGTPVNGTRSISVSIPTIGWSETHTDVAVTDGLYFIVLGSEIPIPGTIFTGADERQMEISVNGTLLSPVTLYKPLAAEQKELNLQGPGNGLLRAEFGAGSLVNENLPSLTLNGNILDSRPRVRLNVSSNADNTSESGSMLISASNGSRSFISTNFLGFYDDGPDKLALFNQNWGNRGQSGTILLRGPSNNLNFEIGNRHWENADLPRINMRGSADNAVIELSASNDENESGFIGLHSKNNRFAFFNNERLFFDSQSKRMITIESANWGNGDFGLARLHGNQSHLSLNNINDQEKIHLGLSGENGREGRLILRGQHPHLAFEDISNQNKIYLGIEDWGNGSFGQLHLRGEHSQVTVFNADNVSKGFFGVYGNHGKLRLAGDGPHIALEKELNSPNNPPIVFMDIQNNGNGDYGRLILNGPNSYVALGLYGRLFTEGNSGHLELRGPTTQNFHIGSAGWENSDRPWMNMTGKDDKGKMTMTTIDDVNGERGIITLSNSNGEETTYANNGTWGSGPFNMWSGAMVSGTLTVNGNIQGSGTNSYNSDERLKKEIQPLSGTTLNKIESLGGYSYFWKKEEFPNKNFSADQQIGLLAQELEAQFPALVKTGDDGFKSVNYNGFTAVLLEAVKELNQKVENLEKENKLLKGELVAATASQKEMNELKSQIEALAKLVQLKIDSANDSQSAENVSTTGLK